jgi:acetyltransferase-like isoleucine patch superfamily enzyme
MEKISSETTSEKSQGSYDQLFERYLRLSFGLKFGYLFRLALGLPLLSRIDNRGLVLSSRGVVIKKKNGTILVNKICRINPDVQIAVVGRSQTIKARLSIGYNTEIGPNTRINVGNSVSIGDECGISWNCDILDNDFHSIVYEDGLPRPSTKPIVIEDHVLVGCNSTILKGVTIGHDSVVAAGSVVVSSVAPYSLVRGNPARLAMRIKGWSNRPFPWDPDDSIGE